MNGRRIYLGLAVLFLAVLIAAWLDGGEEPLRPIVQPVALPPGSLGSTL